jgi:hypothetical protein
MARKKCSQAAEADANLDPLGKPLARYGTRKKAIIFIVIAVLLGLAGGGMMAASKRLARALADSHEDTLYTLMSWVMLVVAVAGVAYGVYHLGQSFEVRRKGVRFTRRRAVAELRWVEIFDIQATRTAVYYRGVRHRVDWEIFIHGIPGLIHLTTSFLHLVPSVTALLSLLKQGTGKEAYVTDETAGF